MAREQDAAESEHVAFDGARAPLWGTVLSILWLATFLACLAGGFYRLLDDSPSGDVRAKVVLAATQTIFAAYSFFLLLVAFLFSRNRQFSWRHTLSFVLVCALLIGVGYDGLARWHPFGTLPTLDQIAHGLVTVAQVGICLFGALLGLRATADAYAPKWAALKGRLSRRAKRSAAGGCLLSITWVVLLSLTPLALSVTSSSSESPEYFGFLFFGLSAIAAVGAIVVFVVALFLALIDAGNDEMRRYQERHGASITLASTDGGMSGE